MCAVAVLSSKPPPLSDFAPFSELSDVFASSLTFPPTVNVMFEASTCAVSLAASAVMASRLEFEKSPMPTVFMSVPLISESTLGIETRPPEPFSVQADVFVFRLVVIRGRRRW